jgi:peptidylprolyl isomerase
MNMIRATVTGIVLAAGLGGAALAQDVSDVMVIEVAGEANGSVQVQLLPDIAPAHVERLETLVREGAYDGVAFHRVIDGFMAQTGDVEFGTEEAFAEGRAGTGGSGYPDLAAEFSDVAYEKGVVGMARSQDPDSANSQFFIMFDEAPFLNGQYTVVGKVISGQEVVDEIKRGEGQSGMISGQPDVMKKVHMKGEE